MGIKIEDHSFRSKITEEGCLVLPDLYDICNSIDPLLNHNVPFDLANAAIVWDAPCSSGSPCGPPTVGLLPSNVQL